MAEARIFRDWHFEPDGEEYLYYMTESSPGVRVTAAERERYLSGDETGWDELIAGREHGSPRRNELALYAKRLGSMPRSYHLLNFMCAVLLVSWARSASIPVAVLCGVGALAFLILGAIGLFARAPERPYGH